MTSLKDYPGQDTGQVPVDSTSKTSRTAIAELLPAALNTPPNAGGGADPRSAQGAQLVNTAKSVRVLRSDAPNTPGMTRVSRWEALGVQWEFSSIERVRSCKHWSIRPGGTVDVRLSERGDAGRVAGYAGLATCGSVWVCPLCSAKIQGTRRDELQRVVEVAQARGYTVVFGTVTLRHRKGQSLKTLWDALNQANRGVTNATRVKRIRTELGRLGYIRVTEVTHGGNGWHPHIHTLQLFEGDVSQEQLDRLADAEFSVWEKQAVRRGLGKPLRERYELRRVTDATVQFSDYFAKNVYDPTVSRSSKSMAFEMQGSATKKAKAGGRTPFQILHDVATTGDADDLDLWHEFEQASKGRRALVWSPGLRDLLGLGEERSDEEIAEEEIGDKDDVVFSILSWQQVHRRSKLGGQILEAVREGGKQAGIDFCDANGIPTAEPDDPEVVEDREMFDRSMYGLPDESFVDLDEDAPSIHDFTAPVFGGSPPGDERRDEALPVPS